MAPPPGVLAPFLALAPLHGGATGGQPHVLVLAVAVVALWGLVAGLVAGIDRLLVAVDGN
ncbi:hypothetical protein ACFPYI_06310 [Halomarina salina]|uniref:Uncharacterized protein n=1 Tax=Halomarina salina TaxID=1872699 RepID=A0ABD5RK25_9EURY|nr:hypothetical protein [Halomarina salina]